MRKETEREKERGNVYLLFLSPTSKNAAVGTLRGIAFGNKFFNL